MKLTPILNETFSLLDEVLQDKQPVSIEAEEIGTISSVGHGIAQATGLPSVQSNELVELPGNLFGMVFNSDIESIGIVILGAGERLAAGMMVRRTGRVLDVPVGEGIIGRVLDPLGRPLDNRGPVHTDKRYAVDRPAPAIMDRAPVEVPLQTGLKVIDALIPIGRGQRELILGDRQTGKTAITIDTVLNQKGRDVICMYCAIGQRSTAVAKVVAELAANDAFEYTTVMVASGHEAPGLLFTAPYAITAMAEYFMEQGRDVLVIYDDLTRHARAYRELSLLLRRPPGREAYPGDIFYIHSRLLERATHLRADLGGGSLTALPIIETEEQNVSAYIPTNLISITDGQVYLSPGLFRKGLLPAVDVGKSVSRVGGKTQLKAYRAVAGDLRLSYSQFEELERFARFGTRLDEETRQTLERGYRVREMLKQPQSQPLSVEEQIAALLAVTEGIFDDLPVAQVQEAERRVREIMSTELPDISGKIRSGEKLSDEDRQKIHAKAQSAVIAMKPEQDETQRGQGRNQIMSSEL